jgi:hypothetical protein
MTTISVLSSSPNGTGFRAVSNGSQATGDTPGQAIDALVAQTGGATGTTLIIVQPAAGDEFFTDDQRRRLGELMARWRAARDAGTVLSADEQAELDALTAAELRAATARAAAALRAVSP